MLAVVIALAAVSPLLSSRCPRSGADEITVCADPEPRQSPYRLPLAQPPEAGTKAATSVGRERNGLFDYDAGGSGLCSSVGPGGASGCAFKQFKRNVQQRANAADPRGRLYDTAPQ